MARSFQGRLVLLALLDALLACGPDSRLVDPGHQRGYWDPSVTRSPSAPDAAARGSGAPSPVTVIDAGGGVPPTRPTAGLDGSSVPPDVPTTAPDASTPAQTDSGGGSHDPPPDVPSGPLGRCSLTFSVTTLVVLGNYSPANIGAIWVSDGNGKFVKTLRVWANRRRGHLDHWLDSSNGNIVDAVTSATMSDEGSRSATWDCTDVGGQPVAGGTYRINIQFKEDNDVGPSEAIPFTRNGKPQTVTAPDQTSFKNARIEIAP